MPASLFELSSAGKQSLSLYTPKGGVAARNVLNWLVIQHISAVQPALVCATITALVLHHTAAGALFELTIAVAVEIFGLNSSESFVGVVGPLIGVPALIGPVNVAFWMPKKYFSNE
jgi:ACR3 family arsenite efflux pump ArsB